jgi:hypothetical protein
VIRGILIFLIGFGFLPSFPLLAQKAAAAPLTDTQKEGRRIFQ